MGGTSAAFGLSLTSIAASATSGSPANPARASANPNQAITLNGVSLDGTTDVVFEVIVDSTGRRGELVVRPSTVNAAGAREQVMVPGNALTGKVRMVGDVNGAALDLQGILPVTTDVQVQSVSSDGLTAQVLITGLGFVEAGNSEYRFGSETIVDLGVNTGPDVQGRFDPTIGTIANGQVTMTVELNAGVFGAISVKTDGGVSASFSLNLSAIEAVALSGTPADATKASANPGQAVTLEAAGSPQQRRVTALHRRQW